MERSRDISKNGFHFWVHHKLFYTHAKFQGSRLSRTEVNLGGPNQPPPSLPRASNTLGLIGLKGHLAGKNWTSVNCVVCI